MKIAHAVTSTALLLLAACTQDASEDPSAVASDIKSTPGDGVSGRVLFAPGSTIPAAWQTQPVIGVVKLLDVTLADGPSTTITSTGFTAKDGSPIPFALSIDNAALDPSHSYAVYAHLDADGDGEVSNGDFVTVQSYPVLTQEHGSTVDVELVAIVASTAARTVSGHVLLSGDTKGVSFPFTGVVEILDVTYADGPSTTIASQTVEVTGPEPIPFEIPIADVQDKVSYSVRAHLDADADGTLSEGDFVTMESFPVLTFGHGDTVDVTVKRF